MIIWSRYLLINSVKLIVITSLFSVSTGHDQTDSISLKAVN
jgi:hypothetical protein